MITFTPDGDGCRVTWQTTYRVPVPIVGPLLARLGGMRIARAFDDAIRIAGDLADRPDREHRGPNVPASPPGAAR